MPFPDFSGDKQFTRQLEVIILVSDCNLYSNKYGPFNSENNDSVVNICVLRKRLVFLLWVRCVFWENEIFYGWFQPKFAQPPSCLCEVGGEIGDCGCDVESVEDYNARLIYPLLQQLRHRSNTEIVVLKASSENTI